MKTNLLMLCAAALASAGALHGSGFVTYGTDSHNHDGTTPPTRPSYLGSYTDPDFNTTVTLVSQSTTSVATDGSAYNYTDGVYWGNTVRNVYWNVQPWNCDMSYVLIQNESFGTDGQTLTGPSPKRLILDGNTYDVEYGLSFEPYEYRWSPVDPDTFFYTTDNSLYEYDIDAQTSTLVQTFSKYPATDGAIILDDSNFSSDGRYLALEAKYNGGYDVWVYDTTVLSPSDGTIKVVNFTTTDGYTFGDNCSVSPSGQFVYVYWADEFTQVYDKSFNLKQTLTLSGLSHFDIAWNGATTDGTTEYAVGVHKNPGSGGYIYDCPLIGTTDTDLITVGYGGDASAQNTAYPGWAYAQYGNNGTSYPLDNEVCGIDLNSTSNSTIRRLGHLFNTRNDYASESHPVPAPDGMRIMFQSNWQNRGGNYRGTDTYIADLRPLLPFADDFEVNNFSTKWTVSNTDYVWRSDLAGFGSDYGMWMRGISGGTTNACTASGISTVGFTTIQVKYAIYTDNLTSGHYFYLDWYDGSTWHDAVDTVGNTEWEQRTITLPSGAAGISGLQLRFRTNATATGEYANIDRVYVVPQ